MKYEICGSPVEWRFSVETQACIMFISSYSNKIDLFILDLPFLWDGKIKLSQQKFTLSKITQKMSGQTCESPGHSIDLDRYLSNFDSDCSRTSTKMGSCEVLEKNISSDKDEIPPMDGGFHAWMFLLASAMLEALVWGRPGC